MFRVRSLFATYPLTLHACLFTSKITSSDIFCHDETFVKEGMLDYRSSPGHFPAVSPPVIENEGDK